MRAVLALLPAVVPVLAFAQERLDEEVFVPVSPIVRVNPDYPRLVLRTGGEGWVMMSFVISETGEVEAPMIEDSSGVEAIEQAALDAVSKWRYTPATVNGKPVAQSMQKTRIVFSLEGPATGATRQFESAYRKIRQLLDAGDYAAAEPLLADMEFGGRHNLYEDALFWALKYGYLEGTGSGDTAEKRRALELALGYQADELLPPAVFVAVAHRLYVLQVQTLDLSAARSTFERLRDSAHARTSREHSRAIAELTPTYEQIEEVIAGREVLPVRAQIGQYGYWVHDLMRRAISVTSVNGRIDEFDIRCDRGTRRYGNYPEETIWEVPDSWGKCGVYVKGERGTTFTLLEHPARTPATPLQRE